MLRYCFLSILFILEASGCASGYDPTCRFLLPTSVCASGYALTGRSLSYDAIKVCMLTNIVRLRKVIILHPVSAFFMQTRQKEFDFAPNSRYLI